MRMVRRTVYPVGQGSFYSEVFFLPEGRVFTVVYDCGSFNTKELHREIDHSGIKEIDLLVISHFHADHINGLIYLNKKGIKARKIVIPQLKGTDLALYVAYAEEMKYEQGLLDFMRDPRTLFPDAVVITITNEDTDTVESVDIDDLTAGQKPYSHNKPFVIKNIPWWVFKFYVDKTVFEGKLTEENTLFLEKTTWENVTKKDRQTKTRKIYENIPSGLNLTSMTMYSGPNGKWWWPESCNGTVTTGDILLDNEKRIESFTKHYEEYRGCINVLQIPHHGSRHNMTRVLTEFNLKKAFIQTGKSNRFDHPSYQIVQMHKEWGIETTVVTERDYRMVF